VVLVEAVCYLGHPKNLLIDLIEIHCGNPSNLIFFSHGPGSCS